MKTYKVWFMTPTGQIARIDIDANSFWVDIGSDGSRGWVAFKDDNNKAVAVIPAPWGFQENVNRDEDK